MAEAIRIEGVEDCLRMFDRFPEKMLQVEISAMRVAARETARHIRKGIPKRFRKLTKSKVYNKGKNTYAMAGLYNKKEISGEQSGKDPVFDWFKAYWSNYGTLRRRDPSHAFQYKIKPKTAGNRRRQSVGQPAQKFFEKAIEGWQDVYVGALENEVKKHEDDLM